ncbi:methyl-accepting chemotaxis protein [Paenibacillus sabinae]|uniref:Methyl-accepting chemotaxis sensory transducer n=1 Tax=Paenibacillus sabinae T27 TaxID=1268072 RepID=X4ZIH1_9BACL|nr:methyl-accepting chemotaxis protein [Paenibacillus sabinae]AHV96510.1 methyl-accepting chemotaxis sensory transducer [Paenibacillus sabinae T27]
MGEAERERKRVQRKERLAKGQRDEGRPGQNLTTREKTGGWFAGITARLSWKRLLTQSAGQFRTVNPAKSVGVKLFLIFLSSIVVVVMFLGLMSYTKAKNTIKDNVSEANRQTIIQNAEKLDIILNQYETLALQLFFDPEVQGQIDNLKNAKSFYDQFVAMDNIGEKLTNQTTSDSNIISFSLIPDNAKQQVMTSGNSKLVSEDMRDKDWYKQAIANTENYKPTFAGDSFSSKFYWFPVSDVVKESTNIAIVRKLQNMGDTSGYVVVIEIKQDALESAFRCVNLGNGSHIQLVSPGGTVIASSVKEEDGKASAYAFIKDSKANNSSIETRDAKGRDLLAVFSPLTKADWKLTGIVPTDALVKDAKPILFTTYIAAGAAALLALLLGVWMVRMIARPLARLKDLMGEGAKGNLTVRTPYTSSDEIGQLSASFNLMMERITELVSQTTESARDVLGTAGELGEASRKTAVSAKEIASATEEIAEGAGSLALEAEKGNELTEALSAQMEAVILSNREMDDRARIVGESSGKGMMQLEELLKQTGRTGQMTKALVDKVDNLKQTALSVLKVLDVMKNITQQTNILSLNATIEAARAGAAGRGFMVVAGEIRALADQSKESIALVANITDKIMTEMNETVDVLSEVTPLFAEQMSSVKNTSDIFLSVREQMDGFVASLQSVTSAVDSLKASQTVLSEAMSNVSAVAEQSSATSEEVASLSSEQQSVSDQLVMLSANLESVSGHLKEKLSLFKI